MLLPKVQSKGDSVGIRHEQGKMAVEATLNPGPKTQTDQSRRVLEADWPAVLAELARAGTRRHHAAPATGGLDTLI